MNSCGTMLKIILNKGSILQTENWRRSSEGLMGSQWKPMKFVSGNTEVLSQSLGWERWMFLWNAKWAKGGKHGSNSPSPSAAAIPAGTAIQQTGETDWESGNMMLGYRSAALESRRGAAARTQGAVGACEGPAGDHSLGCTVHPKRVGQPQKATGRGPLCTKADISFTLIQKQKLSMTLPRSCTACSRFQTSWETRRSFHPPISQHIWGRADL